jgi:hypothetical protein
MLGHPTSGGNLMRVLLKAGVIPGLLILLLLSLPRMSTAQPNIIVGEGFDSTPNGAIPAGWTRVDVDSAHGDPGQPFFGGYTTWQGVNRVGWPTHTGEGVCVDAYNFNATPNDDWLILPHIPPLLEPITLSYWMSAQDQAYLESFEVRVSTTTADLASFTHLIVDTVAARPWLQHTHTLSAFAGAPFYVAFRYTSVNRYALKLDDVSLRGTFPGGAIRGIVKSAVDSLPLNYVTVSLVDTDRTTTTFFDGTYFIGLVPFGYHSVQFTKPGYDTIQENNVAVSQGDTVAVDAYMYPSNAAHNLHGPANSFSFAGNFPNPFNSQTQFRFELTRLGRVSLSLYNTLGQKIAVVTEGQFGPGAHSVSFDARSLATGVYIARLSVQGCAPLNHKVILLK